MLYCRSLTWMRWRRFDYYSPCFWPSWEEVSYFFRWKMRNPSVLERGLYYKDAILLAEWSFSIFFIFCAWVRSLFDLHIWHCCVDCELSFVPKRRSHFRNSRFLLPEFFQQWRIYSQLIISKFQIKILKLLRILGQDDAKASEEMNDILAQVCLCTCWSAVLS